MVGGFGLNACLWPQTQAPRAGGYPFPGLQHRDGAQSSWNDKSLAHSEQFKPGAQPGCRVLPAGRLLRALGEAPGGLRSGGTCMASGGAEPGLGGTASAGLPGPSRLGPCLRLPLGGRGPRLCWITPRPPAGASDMYPPNVSRGAGP